MRTSLYLAIMFTLLIGCQHETSPFVQFRWQEIQARDDGHALERPTLYRARVPLNWERRDPYLSESIVDTVKPNVEFFILDSDEKVRLTVHTFPYTSEAARIPPQAQIVRWKKQLDDLDILSVKTIAESHGGFSGLYFEGEGKLQGEPTIVMGWSMRLGNGFDQQLKRSALPLDLAKRADYTIKAVGSPKMINAHRQSIEQFAQSFELIDELPSPL